jgi:hypothetical protein
MAEKKVIFVAEVYPETHDPADRQFDNTLGSDMYCLCMMDPLVRRAIEIGMIPMGVTYWHLSQSASPRGIKLLFALRQTPETRTDDLMHMILSHTDFYASNGDPEHEPVVRYSYEDWKALPLMTTTRALPIFS